MLRRKVSPQKKKKKKKIIALTIIVQLMFKEKPNAK